MPDTPPVAPTPPVTPTPAPSSPIPPSRTPTKDSESELASMVAPEYRYPADYPLEYLRNKTPGDAAQLLQGLVESVGRGAAAGAQAPAPPPVAGDDDYVTGATLRQAQN